jgi:signal transduction histidine kinase
VNDRPLVGAVELRPGDEILIGGRITFLYSRVRAVDAAETQTAKRIASIVAGVVHELDAPLDFACGAIALIESLVDELRCNPASERVAEILRALEEASAHLVSKNLGRTHELVKSFKKLSAGELMVEHRERDLAGIVSHCVDAVRPTADRQRIALRTDWPRGLAFPWIGFPAAMSKVVEHLLQNCLRYAYTGMQPGAVDIRLKQGKVSYRLEIEDYGAGLPEPIQARLFGSDSHGASDGFGLDVVYMIVTTLFDGTIACRSTKGEGTKFILTIPAVVSSVPE